MTDNRTITAVPGIRLGHATDPDARTGCTVLLGPFRGACDVRGTATGTRELPTLEPDHLVPTADAVLLTGGSAFGLAAADGVAQWLEEHGRGFDTGVARVPIVPAAVIFDLAVGRADRRPDAAMGRAACDAASDRPAGEGRVGVGAGASVGKFAGPAAAMDAGVGTWAQRGDVAVGALAVVNALGDVRGPDGRILAGARAADGTFLNAAAVLARGAAPLPAVSAPPPGANTTLVVVATDAPLDRVALRALARAGSTAMARRIAPVHTPFDGDVAFALSTAPETAPVSAEALLGLCEAAAACVERAIERAVDPGVIGARP